LHFFACKLDQSFRPIANIPGTSQQNEQSMMKGKDMKEKEVPSQQTRGHHSDWEQWGPYLSERQWGTVREDYSETGDAWDYLSHDQARSRAYRWGEDGIAGISDDHQLLCFALALWNGKDPILKERLFGVTNSEGNHGEDVKEYYFYLDNTPTHSYMKYLYKYPQRAYPYDDLVRVNKQRSRDEYEYELLDTGIFEDDRYFDVFVEYAKESPGDILVKITVWNHGPDAAPVTILPTLWFRNTWLKGEGGNRPIIRRAEPAKGASVAEAFNLEIGSMFLYCEGGPEFLFTENETNNQRLFGTSNATARVKDGINDFVVRGITDAANPDGPGTKVSPHYQLTVEAGKKETIRLRLTRVPPQNLREAYPDAKEPFGKYFEKVMEGRIREADELYSRIIPPAIGPEKSMVMRQALAGMLWNKQYYEFDVNEWLEERKADPLLQHSRDSRNKQWFHMLNHDIISMPDKWEYPWYAAWDLAFHTIPLSLVDPNFSKRQLELMVGPLYLHPNGQMPAYEWNFSDVNPPVHAWATIFLYKLQKSEEGVGDREFLKSIFHKLILNFTWWVNRKDRFGKNVFEGGFLGLDNIGIFDRSAGLPGGGYLEQADGTAWMALYCQNMCEIAVELADADPVYQEFCLKFIEHFLWIAAAINRPGGEGLWDEEDGFYYDLLRLPDGSSARLKIRSIVGLLPMCATTVVEAGQREKVTRAMQSLRERLNHMPQLLDTIHPTGPGHFGVNQRGIMALVNPERLRRMLAKMLDENEFLAPYGIRALSRFHLEHPYKMSYGGQDYQVEYLPAESNTGMFGGNSNWRGPIWMPMNGLIIRALLQFYLYYGDNFKVECPTGSGKWMNLFEVSREITDRLTSIFLRDKQGRRPVYGGTQKFQNDPHWRDYLLFYEYFHGDNGAGVGASHQTGWTGLIAGLMRFFGTTDAVSILEGENRFPSRAVAQKPAA
jgi:Mannosylglycerate hydrolase MGH1-like glycoside hydrolase domain